tara:strand:+ start:6607 stop:7071 length:465 start_codon:yes stop_codon:yes gene_type:complete
MKSFKEIVMTFLKTVKSDTDTYTSVKAEIVENSTTSYSVLTADHLFYAKNGRKAGKAPPLEQMLNFVKSKNILFDGLDSRGAAFAMQAIIKKKGTKNYKGPGGTDPLLDAVNKYQRKYEEDLGSFILIDINNKINEEMKDYWKEQDELLKDFKI